MCMGYGLVKYETSMKKIIFFKKKAFCRPTLGQEWNRVLFLGFLNFIFNALYNSEMISSSANAPIGLVLVYIIPLAITITIFYVWTLSELTATIAKLALRRQSVKLRTYVNLRRVLYFAFLELVIFVAVAIVQQQDTANIDLYWDSLWFTTDCSLTFVYLVVLVAVLILWRPRANNIRAGVEQLPSDDLHDDDFDEVELDRVAIVGSITSDKLKSRKSKKAAPQVTARLRVYCFIQNPPTRYY